MWTGLGTRRRSRHPLRRVPGVFVAVCLLWCFSPGMWSPGVLPGRPAMWGSGSTMTPAFIRSHRAHLFRAASTMQAVMQCSAVKEDRQGRRAVPKALPSLTAPADREKHVFISVDGLSGALKDFFKEEHFVFVRGGVGCGKSTLAKQLARDSDDFVFVPLSGGSEAGWIRNTVEAVTGTAPHVSESRAQLEVLFTEAQRQAKSENKILIYDEAHTLFACPWLCSALFKCSDEFRARILLFSASGDGATVRGTLVTTPLEIQEKRMWKPAMPEAAGLQAELQEAGVDLDEKSIDFFLRFSGAHRSIFMAAMAWVCQEQAGSQGPRWDIGTTTALVRRSCAGEDWSEGTLLGSLSKSRAVRVNGGAGDFESIPFDFFRLLYEGPSQVRSAVVRRDLCINGFILPKPRRIAEEFSPLDWANNSTKYEVANPLLAMYYRHTFPMDYKVKPFVPKSCVDLLMRALPYLTFAKVVNLPPGRQILSPLSPQDLPYEEQYTAAIISVLRKKLGYEAYDVVSPRHGMGKIDCQVRINGMLFGMEGVMAARGPTGIDKHRIRFDEKTHYKENDHKALYIIGKNDRVLEQVKRVKADGVQIIGLVPNAAHTGYKVHLRTEGSAVGSEPISFDVECDLVARSVHIAEGKAVIKCVQKLKTKWLMRVRGLARQKVRIAPGKNVIKWLLKLVTPPPAPQVWVLQLEPDDKEDAKVKPIDEDAEFKVRPEDMDVDGLKKAIKRENPNSVQCDAKDLTIFSLEDGVWTKEKPKAAVSSDKTYGYLLPQPQ